MQTEVDRWLDRQPLWLYAGITYVASFGIWTGSMYAGAWAAGGQRAGDAGFFPDGTFAYTHALIIAAVFTAAVIGFQRWRRTRRAGKA